MKKVFILLLSLSLALTIAACSQQQKGAETIEVKNGYETSGNGRIEWFQLNPDDLLNEINKRATTSGYKELKILENTDKSNHDSHMFSNNGDTWYILAHTWDSDYDPKEANNKIHKIDLSLYATDETRAKMNGYYLNMLIDMFNPGMADKVTDVLYVYKEAPEDTPNLRQVVCGNVKYSYVFSKTHSSEFHIEPDKVEVESKGNRSPIKP